MEPALFAPCCPSAWHTRHGAGGVQNFQVGTEQVFSECMWNGPKICGHIALDELALILGNNLKVYADPNSWNFLSDETSWKFSEEF